MRVGLLAKPDPGEVRGIEGDPRQFPEIGAPLHDFSRHDPRGVDHEDHGFAVRRENDLSFTGGELCEVGGPGAGVENHGEVARVRENFVHARIVGVVVALEEAGVLKAKVREAPGGDVFARFAVLDQDHEFDLGVETADAAAVAVLLGVEAADAAFANGRKRLHEGKCSRYLPNAASN
jgi:hypothetical protein